MTESRSQPHAFLKSLFQRLEDLEPDFPSPEDLQGLGIQTFEVPFDPDEETLKFDPCFFRPHPDKLLERYPIHPEVEQDYRESYLKITRARTIQEYMEDSPTEYPPHTAPILENLTWMDRDDYEFDNIEYDQAREIERVISCHLDTQRQGPSDYFTLEQLRNQEYWRPVDYKSFPDYEAGDPSPLEDYTAPRTWGVVSPYRYTDRPLKPHSLMSSLAHIRPTETRRGITTHELSAIVCTMLLRVNHKPFRRCRIHPVLVFSYMGGQQGRIIQALYDGKKMILQCSQLWNFGDEEKAPVELFVRYRLCEPVGGTYTLSIR
ncbi:hypothetical protein N7489_008742 [Penicillium chrysogenum]|uniref:uncharacterized protein n=1 Tax=Penicillium chrysogenum TaxID=5076 RepID=UPI0024DF2BFE|nr:uncharacterized protein N7489_008742 [Penicillium chrysogenum]KAJ5228034.1 hypothetical protein N7489_008742 [Penicillium chrysogenum]KAJ6167539.1 hypothetical protein N7497_000382 [Penicillium chrysogenum]